ncbi:ABC transporter ATP-binding protein [Niallia circulans]|uniref:Multidrug ABC transporter ATP-binding protein n=1 Tax=Niallia circulans TaxID=1397 RepID=A0A268FBV5_NIACI|nr:ABC transporter ATP-binding protein [Niallia circulans]AYV69333.1 ABC transporter ATP-binding protein [Niallia circulans]AYV72273.1 ABC transporter ATP-binding protein [Niallia circulans]PAD82851.1 multidrug ABC transporter ATP-binding protein [Niallia circulans]QJX60808.1 ABC transporter ATP-binding protein [Niallia circulans]
MQKELTDPFRYPKPKLRSDPTVVKKGKKPKNMGKTLYRLWSYLAQKKGLLFLVLVMVAMSCALGLLGPYVLGMSIDRFIVNRNLDGFTGMLIALGGIYFFYSVALFLQSYWMVGISQTTVFRLRADLFHQFHELPISYFDKKQHGELMSRVTNDIENVSSTLNSSVIQIFSSIITLVGTIVVMFLLSPLLTVLTLTIVPVMFIGMKWITSRTSILFKEQQKNLGELNGFIEESISGQKIVKTFSLEEKMIHDMKEKSDKLKNSAYWAQVYSGFIPKLMNMLNNASYAVIVGVGGLLALKSGTVSIGVIIIFVEYSRQFTRPLNDLSNQFNTLLSAIAGAERVFEVLDEEREEVDEKEAAVMKEMKGEVQFKHVSFSYEVNKEILKDIDFKANPGETIALVGPTGAGKTTIIQLIMRFYDATAGSILVDGQEITKVKRESLRSHMGFVLQDSYLFEGTIRENIRYGRLNASDEEVEYAAKQANAHGFIEHLPEGYDTILSANGNGISQGQKQLLSISRAILADPSILILDEATSSIDTITEVKIQDALKRLMKGKTSFVVAHRLNTIKHADLILVLDKGMIAEKGSHEELLKRKGFYYELHQNQFSETVD